MVGKEDMFVLREVSGKLILIWGLELFTRGQSTGLFDN